METLYIRSGCNKAEEWTEKDLFNNRLDNWLNTYKLPEQQKMEEDGVTTTTANAHNFYAGK